MINSSFFLCRANVASTLVLTYSVLLILLIRTAKATTKQPENEKFLAIQVFGDSIVDTGNNNGLKTLIKSNFPPYGRDFKEGKATGRFCNGKIISDFIAEAMGIKELLPSYHELPNLQSKDLQTGLSFASGGSGYDPLTAKLLQVYTQQEQLKFFEDYLVKLKSDVGEERSKTIIDKSLFVLSSGNNDILITYFASQVRKLQFDVPSYTDFLLNLASRFLRDLYQRGARKIGVFSVAPLGCTPFARTLGGGLHRECVEKINKAVQLFNAKLTSEIASLNRQFPDSKFVLVDIYDPVIRVIQNPTKQGYHIIGKGCCNTGTLETGILCNKLSVICDNTSEYMFWDSIHPTEETYKTLAPPIIQQLIF